MDPLAAPVGHPLALQVLSPASTTQSSALPRPTSSGTQALNLLGQQTPTAEAATAQR